ncbi:hypothetical protein BH10BDE1_BH10BDE1_20030 [soil metagenome]
MRPLLSSVLSVFIGATAAFAMDSTMVLPESVNSPSIRMGVVSGIGFKFMGSGDLMSQGEVNSVEFDVRQLSQFEPRVNQLVSALNQFGPNKLGDQLSLGVLRVDTVPEVRYFAPVYARGITANWTLGFGIPILTYKNKITLTQTGSNIEAMRAQIGNAVPQINSAFNDLSVNLATTAQETLIKKGYKPLVDHDETQIGDLQLVSVVQFAKRERTSLQFKTIFSLPTGQGNDPDDLADLGAFGFMALENQILGNYILSGRWQLAAKTGYRYTFSDRVERRVPQNETDSLPDQSTRETVGRSTGGAVFVGGSLTYSATETIDLAVGIESTRKAADTYAGNRGSRYDLLERDTNANSDRIRLGVTYSSVETFLAGKAWLPSMIAYEFSDTVRGLNTERQTIHEIWLQLFF